MRSRIIYDEQERMTSWAAARMNHDGFRFRDDAQAIGREIDGELVAVVVFDTFSDGDCLIHVVSDGSRRWFSRPFVIMAMAYPFQQLHKRRITALVREDNDASNALCSNFGFVLEGRMRSAAGEGQDMLLWGLLREDYFAKRWHRRTVPSIVRAAAA